MALIINADMPKNCEECPFIEYWEANPWTYGQRCWITKKSTKCTDKPSDCPILGEVPDEHGRIGDLDKLAEEFDGHGVYMEEEVKKIIDSFPVVLEAST